MVSSITDLTETLQILELRKVLFKIGEQALELALYISNPVGGLNRVAKHYTAAAVTEEGTHRHRDKYALKSSAFTLRTVTNSFTLRDRN
uniref:Uncharacterized protein n=1 Tax=Hyaloperonospora arabidopsidis (strain Emoy2) TaxID=559515 RepID=M4C417_HYAAE